MSLKCPSQLATSPSAIRVLLPDDYVKRTAKSGRRIFFNVSFTAEENHKLEELKIYLDNHNIKPPSWWTSALSLKILYTAKFDLHQAAA